MSLEEFLEKINVIVENSSSDNYLENLNKSKLDQFSIYKQFPLNSEVVIYLKNKKIYLVLIFFQSHVYLQTKFFISKNKLRNNYSEFSFNPNFSDSLLFIPNKNPQIINNNGFCLNTIAFVNSKENCELLDGTWKEIA